MIDNDENSDKNDEEWDNGCCGGSTEGDDKFQCWGGGRPLQS